MDQVIEFLEKIFDNSDWPPRWHCGRWTEFHGWLYIISDLLIWSAYFSIPIVIIRYISKKQGIRFVRLYFLFAAFILACGATHFLDAIAFWIPAYRLSALVRLITGVLSWITVFYLIKLLPAAFSLKSQKELEAEIEQRKKAEQQVRENEEQIQVLFDAAPDAVIVIDDLGKIVKWNPRAETLFGWKENEVTGKLLSEIIIPDRFREAHKKGMKHFLRTGEGPLLGKVIETCAITKNNTELDVALNIAATPKVKDRFLFIGFVRDISGQKRAEKKFEGLLEAAPDAIIIANDKGEIVLVNRQTESLFGYSRDELIGKPVEILIPVDFRSRHEGHRHKYFADPKVRSMGAGLELYAVRKDGTRFPVEISLSPLETTEGTLVSAAIRDITDRNRIEAQIQKQKQDIQDFIDSMSTLCAKVTTDGKLLMVNKTALLATGLPMEELMKTNFLEGEWWTYDPEVHARVCRAFEKACSGIPVTYDENIFVFGRVLPINFSLIPILKPDGQVDYIVSEGRDITTLKITEDALKDRTVQLETVNKELEAFTYSVSHDLRAPLRSIIGFTAILEEDYSSKLDEEAKRVTSVIKNNTLKMGHLIDDLLNFSRTARKDIAKDFVDMNVILKEVIAELAPGEYKPGITWNIHSLPVVRADLNTIRQVWINLISNALKYSGKKKRRHIEIGTFKKETEIVFFIKDNGIGFDMQYSDKLFKVFQRLHSAEEFEGTGVGLALVEKIISRHGGKVWAEGEVNKGATFWFSLPAE